jgi:sigma-E factor negative regulatory protein RseC
MHEHITIPEEIQEGFILSVDGDLAKIRVAPNADCDNCGQCAIAHVEIIAYNSINAAIGEKIKFTMVHDSMIKIAFMIFIFPLISIFAGIYAGSVRAASLNTSETAGSISVRYCFLLLQYLSCILMIKNIS